MRWGYEFGHKFSTLSNSSSRSFLTTVTIFYLLTEYKKIRVIDVIRLIQHGNKNKNNFETTLNIFIPSFLKWIETCEGGYFLKNFSINLVRQIQIWSRCSRLVERTTGRFVSSASRLTLVGRPPLSDSANCIVLVTLGPSPLITLIAVR